MAPSLATAGPHGSPTEAVVPFVLDPNSRLRSAPGPSPPRIPAFHPARLLSPHPPPCERALRGAETGAGASGTHTVTGGGCEASFTARPKSQKQKNNSSLGKVSPRADGRLPPSGPSLSCPMGALLRRDGPRGARSRAVDHAGRQTVPAGRGSQLMKARGWRSRPLALHPPHHPARVTLPAPGLRNAGAVAGHPPCVRGADELSAGSSESFSGLWGPQADRCGATAGRSAPATCMIASRLATSSLSRVGSEVSVC